MAGKPGRKPRQNAESPPSSGFVKVTFKLSDLTAKRLGVQAVMTRESQSDIVEKVLSAYLSGWRLPSRVGAEPNLQLDPPDSAENAA